MEKKDIFYPSADSIHNIHAIAWIPDGEVKAVLQIVHGMAEYIDRYDELARYFCERGYVVTGDDHLGHGQSVNSKDELGYFAKENPVETVIADERSLFELTKKEYPDVPYYILGHSMGSFITRNFLAKYSEDLTGAIVCGTGLQPPAILGVARFLAGAQKCFGGDKKPAGLINGIAFGSYNAHIKNAQTEYDWLSVNPANVEKYVADDLCGVLFTGNGFRTLFGLIKGCQKKEAFSLAKKDLPILVTAGDEDPVGNYGKAPTKVAELYKAGGMTNVSLKLYEGLRHEIFNEDVREQVYADFFAFLDGINK